MNTVCTVIWQAPDAGRLGRGMNPQERLTKRAAGFSPRGAPRQPHALRHGFVRHSKKVASGGMPIGFHVRPQGGRAGHLDPLA